MPRGVSRPSLEGLADGDLHVKVQFLFRYVGGALKKFEIELRSVMEKEKGKV